MTRRSIREIERAIAAIEDESGESEELTVEITEKIIHTDWSSDDANEEHDENHDNFDPGDVVAVESVVYET